MTKRKWRIGLVGVGRGSGYGRVFAGHPECEVTACCDVSAEALARFQKSLGLPDSQCFTSYDDFVASGLDIVFLGTPMPYHADEAVKALEAGAHALSEVTMATTVEDCQHIITAVRRTGRRYMLAENCIFWPFVQDWKRMVQAGRLGEIFYAECEYLHPIPELIVEPGTGRELWRSGRPPLHYCTHSLGPILEIMGDRITRAMGLGQGHRVLPTGGVGGIDIQVALFETQKGAIIKLLRSSVIPRGPRMHFYSLQGTKGFVETDRLGPSGRAYLYVAGEMKQAEEIQCPRVDESLPKEARAGGHGTAEYALVMSFLAALDKGEKPPLDEVRAFELSAPGLIAHESATQGGVWMNVPQNE
jgi:predicted dehydrogenase